MKAMYIPILFLVLLPFQVAFAFDGVSNTLLNVQSGTLLSAKSFEFSPTFNHTLIAKEKAGEFSFRMTLGLLERWEFGMNLPITWSQKGSESFVGVEVIGVGTKVLLWQETNKGLFLSWILGAQIGVKESSITFGTGVGFSAQPHERLQIDASLLFYPQLRDYNLRSGVIRYEAGIGINLSPPILQLFFECAHEVPILGQDPMLLEMSLGINWNFANQKTFTIGLIFPNLLGEECSRFFVSTSFAILF